MKRVYLYLGDKIIAPKIKKNEGCIPVYIHQHQVFKNVTENLIFSRSFIKEFEKENKSDLMFDLINEQVFYYWSKCWNKQGTTNYCGLSEENANQLIKYLEFIFPKQKGKFKIVVENIELTSKNTPWYNEGFLY